MKMAELLPLTVYKFGLFFFIFFVQCPHVQDTKDMTHRQNFNAHIVSICDNPLSQVN